MVNSSSLILENIASSHSTVRNGEQTFSTAGDRGLSGPRGRAGEDGKPGRPGTPGICAWKVAGQHKN